MADHKPPERIAIVGGGISGIACLWGLRHFASSEVHLYEADAQLGGHSRSFTLKNTDTTVDTGFIAAQEDMYPNFIAFLKELNVPTIPTDMSFGVSEDGGSMEWGGSSLWGFIGSWSRLCRPWFWRLAFDIVRFNFFATDIFAEKSGRRQRKDEKSQGKSELESVGEYLDRNRYSEQFKRYYLIPMTASPWCMSPADVARGFPAETLVYFMLRHRLNSITDTFTWRSFEFGSKTYVDAFLKTLPSNHHYHLGTKIRCVRQREKKSNSQTAASLVFADGSSEEFDHVVLAVHANQALELLGKQSTTLEKEILGSFRTSRNEAVLHLDSSVMPKSPSAWASWNCVLEACPKSTKTKPTLDTESERQICVHNDMNKLQSIPYPGQPNSPGHVFVSLNPTCTPNFIQHRQIYYHPIIDSRSVQATRKLHLINNADAHISFAGAWMGYGFHEDGFNAGLAVARKLTTGEYENPTSVRYDEDLGEWIPTPSMGSSLVRAVLAAVQFVIERVEDYFPSI